jgi:hypothetical protein
MPKSERDSETTRIARAYVDSLEGLLAADERAPSSMPPQRSPSGVRALLGTLPRLAGRRLMSSGGSDIYLVDNEGYRRHIADRATYNRLFRDFRGIIETKVDPIAAGPPLGPGTVLVRGFHSKEIYVIDQGYKRLVSGPDVMDKYWFDWQRVSPIDEAVLESIVSGADWK